MMFILVTEYSLVFLFLSSPVLLYTIPPPDFLLTSDLSSSSFLTGELPIGGDGHCYGTMTSD